MINANDVPPMDDSDTDYDEDGYPFDDEPGHTTTEDVDHEAGSDEAGGGVFDFEFEDAVDFELGKLRIRHEVRQRFDAEKKRPAINYPPVKSLTAVLDEPTTPSGTASRPSVPAEARTLLVAHIQGRGKPHSRDNMTRSLVDSETSSSASSPSTTPPRRLVLTAQLKVAAQHTMRAWLRDQNIRNTDAVADAVSPCAATSPHSTSLTTTAPRPVGQAVPQTWV